MTATIFFQINKKTLSKTKLTFARKFLPKHCSLRVHQGENSLCEVLDTNLES